MPETQETRTGSLDQEDPLEKETATHPSILAWRVSWTEETTVYMGSQRVGQDWTDETKQEVTAVTFGDWDEEVSRCIYNV